MLSQKCQDERGQCRQDQFRNQVFQNELKNRSSHEPLRQEMKICSHCNGVHCGISNIIKI